MASVTVRTVGQVAVATHRKVTIKAGAEVLTLPITDPEVTHSNLTPDWVQIPRPGQRPLLRRGAERLRQMTFNVTFYDAGASVEKGLQILRRFATLKGPLAVSYGPTDSGLWQMNDAQVVVNQRQFGTNNATQATASLTFTEWYPDGYKVPTAAKPVARSAPRAAAPAKTATTATKPRSKTYTVRAGDTLSRIAVRMYGDANRFLDIAKANKMRDPNRIVPGQRLVIP